MLVSFVFHLLSCFGLLNWALGSLATTPLQEDAVKDFFGANATTSGASHTNNWAVLVCASRYWFNYRVCLFIHFYELFTILWYSSAYGQRPGNVSTHRIKGFMD